MSRFPNTASLFSVYMTHRGARIVQSAQRWQPRPAFYPSPTSTFHRACPPSPLPTPPNSAPCTLSKSNMLPPQPFQEESSTMPPAPPHLTSFPQGTSNQSPPFPIHAHTSFHYNVSPSACGPSPNNECPIQPPPLPPWLHPTPHPPQNPQSKPRLSPFLFLVGQEELRDLLPLEVQLVLVVLLDGLLLPDGVVLLRQEQLERQHGRLRRVVRIRPTAHMYARAHTHTHTH